MFCRYLLVRSLVLDSLKDFWLIMGADYTLGYGTLNLDVWDILTCVNLFRTFELVRN